MNYASRQPRPSQLKPLSPKSRPFELIAYEAFRNTPGVQFFNITIAQSNARDLVMHDGPAISPNNAPDGSWQFYLHPHQEDNLLALSGGRTFYLINFDWDEPLHIVRLEAGGDILQIPPGTFHRSVSDPQGSIVLNQAVRSQTATIAGEFRVYNSGHIAKLQQLLQHWSEPMVA